MKVKVLLEPVSADRVYLAGEELDLNEHDAKMLSRFGIVQILSSKPVDKSKGKGKGTHETETETESEA
jgi:hypothetical protein